jgi:hypothetical protein
LERNLFSWIAIKRRRVAAAITPIISLSAGTNDEGTISAEYLFGYPGRPNQPRFTSTITGTKSRTYRREYIVGIEVVTIQTPYW